MKTKPGKIEITLASEENAASIAALERECIECPWSEKQIAESIKNPGYTFFAANLDGAFAGYIGIEWCLDEGNICNVAVSPGARRAGVATALVTALADEAKRRGAVRLFLEVNENNAAAKSLYDKFGFTVSYRRPNYYSSEAALVMIKEIDRI